MVRPAQPRTGHSCRPLSYLIGKECCRRGRGSQYWHSGRLWGARVYRRAQRHRCWRRSCLVMDLGRWCRRMASWFGVPLGPWGRGCACRCLVVDCRRRRMGCRLGVDFGNRRWRMECCLAMGRGCRRWRMGCRLAVRLGPRRRGCACCGLVADCRRRRMGCCLAGDLGSRRWRMGCCLVMDGGRWRWRQECLAVGLGRCCRCMGLGQGRSSSRNCFGLTRCRHKSTGFLSATGKVWVGTIS